MQLTLVQSDSNHYPLTAILIRGGSMANCIRECQLLEINLNEVSIYAIPGTVANTVWGYLVTLTVQIANDSIGKHQRCQQVTSNLWIPERCELHPKLTLGELAKLLPGAPFTVHPDFGWVELSDPINVEELITMPANNSVELMRPSSSVSVPTTIRSYQVLSIPQEEVLSRLEEKLFPARKEFNDKPLNLFEKIRLQLYRVAVQKTIKSTPTDGQQRELGKSTLIGRIFKHFNVNDRIAQDFQDLEERNKKNIEKLMDLLKNNPDQALQYAIPLDEQGTSRGEGKSNFDFAKRWFDFSLTGSQINSGHSGSVDLGIHYYDLQKQYQRTAEELIDKKDYQKAAFVYMKLLKNHRAAAETLATGKFYQEAATIYLKHCNDRKRAAECYEMGNMATDAIKLYAELNEFEKVGDLYMSISNREQAFIYYGKTIEGYEQRGQYVKASLLYRDKMNNPQAGQAMLLSGWKSRKDGVNCLVTYFANIEENDFQNELSHVYLNFVEAGNAESFLEVIKHDYRKRVSAREKLKDLAYEVVSNNISTNPNIVAELKNFNPENRELFKDTLRFKLSRNVKGK